MTSLALIVPALPPCTDGVADYSHHLYKHWPKSEEWTFVVAAGATASRSVLGAERIVEFDRNEHSLRAALEESDCELALLQYVGYAYDPFGGAPDWLPSALEKWQAVRPTRRVVVNFHETWASGKPWQRVYWQQRQQKRCAQNLLELCSAAATSNPGSLRELEALRIHKPISLIPIGSNLLASRTAEKNWRSIVVFGKEASRLRAVKRHIGLLRQLVRENIIDVVVLSGESSGVAPDRAESLLRSLRLPVRVETAYNFAPSAIPRLVMSSGLSLMHTQSSFVLKSGCFQMAAHLGQVAIMNLEEQPGDPLIVGKHALGYTKHSIAELNSVLRDRQLLETISQAVMKLAAGPLSWQAIARSWSELIDASLA